MPTLRVGAMTRSFESIATVSASTKRATMVGGKISSTTTIESSLLIVPLMPLDPETQRTQMIENPLGIWITFVEGSYDILNGDILVIGSDEYNIRSVAPWEIDEETTYQLILEKPKVSA